MQEKSVLELRGICKYFPGIKALENVDFTLREGEIHALMGENGAGKSTLIKVLTGVYKKDGGEIFVKGHQGAVAIRSPQDAQNIGISTVYQEITLCPNLTVAENMYIGRTKGAMTNWRKMNQGAAKLLHALGIKPFDFHIQKGEVNGFTGLLGSGRSECVRAIFGADHKTQGKVLMDGKEVKISKPLDAMKLGIGYLPEDRKRDGIVGDLSVRDNIILAMQVMKGFFHPISKAKAQAYAKEYIKLLEIKTASADTPIKQLSGGNQQKCILARWLLTDPRYLILDEPTRGIDVGTKTEIQKRVLKLAAEGKSVTFISSEIDEMLRTCSRLVVMRDRKMVGELTGDQLNQTQVMATIAGGES